MTTFRQTNEQDDTVRTGAEFTAPVTTENKEVVRRLMEDVFSRGQWTLLPELIADDYVGHFAIGDHYGPEGVRIEMATYQTMFADLVVTLDDLFADGDTVIRRFTLRGVHRRRSVDSQLVILRGIAIDRLAEGRLVESWVLIESPPMCADSVSAR